MIVNIIFLFFFFIFKIDSTIITKCNLLFEILGDEVQKSLDWLKKNHKNSSVDDLINWKITFNYRKSWMTIHQHKTVQAIYIEWPQLKSPHAPELIMQDFEMKYKNQRANWQPFIKYIYSLKECNKRDTICLNMVDLEANATNGGKALIQLLHLAHLFPRKRKNLKISKGK